MSKGPDVTYTITYAREMAFEEALRGLMLNETSVGLSFNDGRDIERAYIVGYRRENDRTWITYVPQEDGDSWVEARADASTVEIHVW